MASPISSQGISAIQMFSAANAFKSSMSNPIKPQQQPEIEQGTEIKDTDLLKNQNVDEIKKYAELAGENISEDDIKYGLSYGRSVIAEYFA